MYYLADLPAEWFQEPISNSEKFVPNRNDFAPNNKKFIQNKEFIANKMILNSMADNGSRGPPDLI